VALSLAVWRQETKQEGEEELVWGVEAEETKPQREPERRV
jgi:hypothetical protein